MDQVTRRDPVASRFELQLKTDPDRDLVVGAGREWNARDIHRASTTIARSVGAIAPVGSSVAVRAANGATFLATLLGVLRAQCVAVLIDAGSPVDETERIAEALAATALCDAPDPWSCTASVRALPTRDAARYSSAGVIKLTSGSSGQPRGVWVDSDALLADSVALQAAFGSSVGERLLATIPMSHSYGLSVLAIPALTCGQTLIVPHGQHPLRVARDHAASLFPTVPSYLRALLTDDDLEWPTSLQHVIVAGEPMCPQIAAEFRTRTELDVHVFYGASESGGITYDRRGGAATRGTVGEPIPGVRIDLDETTDSPEPVVVVESPAVGRRYCPAPTPRLADGRFTTDDLGTWLDGELALRGRRSRWINVRGRKIDPVELETIIGRLEGVDEVAVVAEPRNETESALKAVIATRRPLTYLEVATWCRERLAPHKMPRRIVFVENLPRTPRGKLDRTALARQ